MDQSKNYDRLVLLTMIGSLPVASRRKPVVNRVCGQFWGELMVASSNLILKMNLLQPCVLDRDRCEVRARTI